ncbi:MAG: hypothetical protein H0V17_08215 [Deltaproteobacteria bacterium]|nr:hypothetical protein [Deltaproteobacteria bacterium]
MTSTALVTRRGYLDAQRRAIIARSLASALASALPLPFLDDWAVGRVLGGGYRRIAAKHQIDIDDDALSTLIYGSSKPPSIADVAIGGILLRIASTASKRMMVILATVNRARAAARTFVTMTLFDHYCAKLHTGLAIDKPTALALREEIGRAIDNTPGALSWKPFRRGALAAARASLKAPLELADIASRGALRRLLAKKSEVIEPHAEADDLERSIETALANRTNFLSRATLAVEVQLTAESNPFLDSVIDSLDLRWRARLAAKPDR